jgi:cell division protein FtsI/penicillin-binding protein 2
MVSQQRRNIEIRLTCRIRRGTLGPPHSWFIGFAPAQEGGEPVIAVAVLIESGGSGSDRAAPIGGRVMAEYLRLLDSGG